MVADVEREAMTVIADFAGSLVVAAAEAAEVSLLGKAIAAAVAAAVTFAIAVNEAVVLKVPVVTVVVIVAAAVSSETGSAVKTVEGFVVKVLAAAAFGRDLVASPFVAETASPLVVMSTDLNSC
ncbi:hypothetical protein TorRG33x02_195570 [Trema orientale]|uniref:Uncharacterized protein n=1 Tax=Trema orientale TaxID=63057 RepID=A0A2P5EGE9_TREOI|nr:hypothetical protein TorRG33x02_195570 [Trema orientale]